MGEQRSTELVGSAKQVRRRTRHKGQGASLALTVVIMQPAPINGQGVAFLAQAPAYPELDHILRNPHLSRHKPLVTLTPPPYNYKA